MTNARLTCRISARLWNRLSRVPRRGDRAVMTGQGGQKRVLVVLGTVVLYGMERAVVDLFDLLRPEINGVFLVSRQGARARVPLFREIERRGLPYILLSDYWSWPMLGRPRSLLHALQMLAALVTSNLDTLRASRGCDAVYVPNPFFLLYSILPCLVFRLTGRQVIYEFHNVVDARVRISRILRVFHPLLTHVVCGSQLALAEVCRNQPYIPPSKLRLALRSVPESRATTLPAPADAPARERAVVFLGQVTEAKGPDLLLEAFAELSRDFPDVRLHIVGGVDPAFQDRLDACIRNRGLEERVSVWGFRTDARSFLTHAFLFVQPTRPVLHVETAPLAVLEAMAEGVPQIVFPSGALAEFVVQDHTGRVCSEPTVPSLSTEMRRFLTSPDLHARCSAGSRARFSSRHAPEVARSRWLEILGASRRELPVEESRPA